MSKRMKLAEGSRWEGNAVVDRTGARSLCEQSGGTSPGWVLATSDEGEPGIWVTDALAVIDAAGLDRVRAAAREICCLWRLMMPAEQRPDPRADQIKAASPSLARMLDDLVHALDDESEDE